MTQMWGPVSCVCTWAAALCIGVVLSHLGGREVLRVPSPPGRRATMPCVYHYEDVRNLSQLSVQWRSPRRGLLCHYIKHRAFRNCTPGYDISYAPGRVTLTIREVRREDFGTHVCSVSKRHEFSDSSVELVMATENVTTAAPTSGCDPPGPTARLALLPALVLLRCM